MASAPKPRTVLITVAALRALATEGIQRGHMALHRKSQPVAVLEPPQPIATSAASEGSRT